MDLGRTAARGRFGCLNRDRGAQAADASGGKRIDFRSTQGFEAQGAGQFEFYVLRERRSGSAARPDANLSAGIDILRDVDRDSQSYAAGIGLYRLLKARTNGGAKATGVGSI